MSRKVQVILEVISKGFSAFSKVSGALDKFNSKLTNTFRRIVNLPNIIAGAAIGGMTAQLLKADMQMEAINNRLDAALGKFTDTQEEMSYLREEADRLGISFVNLSHSYSGFSASTTRAGISLEETREIFKNIAETSVSLGMSGNDVKLTFLALEQMASKGKVSMEELRRQLGERLPGALEIAAKSMGMTTAQFNKAIKRGEVYAYDFLPNFSRAIREELGGSFDTASKQLIANTQRWQTAFFLLRQKAGEMLNPIANEIVANLIVKMDEWGKSLVKNKDKIQGALEKVPGYFEKVLRAVSAFTRYVYEHRETIYLVGIVVALSKAVVAINSLKIAFIGLNIVMYANPILAVAAALVSLGVIAGMTAQNAEAFKKQLGDNAKIKDASEKIGLLTAALSLYNQQLDTAEYSDKMGLIVEENKVLENELDRVEDGLGQFGIALEGGLLKKIEIVEDYLGRLNGTIRKTAETAVKSYEKITAPKKEDEESSGKKAKAIAPWWMGVGKSIRTSDKYRIMKGEWSNALEDMYDKLMDFSVKVNTLEETMMIRRSELWGEQKEIMISSMKGAFMTLVEIDGTFTEKIQAIMKGFYSQSMSMLYDWVAEYVKAKVYEQTIGVAAEKAKQAANITTAATEGAGAAAGAGKAVASIPYVGPILAVAAIATVFGAISSMISAARKYSIGTRYAPSGVALVGERGPELMQMRGGERIIPNDQIGGMGSTVNFNVTVNGNMDRPTAATMVNEMKKLAQTYYNAIRFNYLKPGLVK